MRTLGFRTLGTTACIVLALACLSWAQNASLVRDELVQQARAAVAAKQYKTAQELFARLVERNPNDLEARTWVARLQSWQQNYAAAERGYRDVLSADPDNAEAELGLIDVLGWQQQYAEPQQRLERLRKSRPNDPEVVVRLARISRWQGRASEAKGLYRELLALNPADPEVRREAESALSETRFRLAFGYSHDDYDFAENANGGFMELAYRASERATLVGRLQYQSKFGEQEPRYSLGTTYRIRERTWMHSELGVSSRGATVLPQQDVMFELTQGVRSGLAFGGGYRFLNFRDASVQVVSALADWDLRRDVHLYLRYVPSLTHFDATGGRTWNHSGWSRLVWDVNRTFSPYLLYAVGAESFEAITADQLGRFSAHTYGGGAEVRLTSVQGFRVGYYYQRRTQDRRQHSLDVSYFFNF